MKNVVLVEGLTVSTAAGKLTGTELIEKMTGVSLNKGVSVRLIALGYALDKIIPVAKNYLLERCANTGAYLDPETGLEISTKDSVRTVITSTEIERLKAAIKVEEEAIKKGVKKPGAKVTKTPYVSWALVK